MNPSDFSWLGNHLWQSTLFAGAVGLLTLTLRKYQARIRHGLWLAASIKFLIPFSVLVALGGQIRWNTVPEIAQFHVPDMVEQVSQPFMPAMDSAPVPAATRPRADSLLPAVLLTMWVAGFLGFAGSWWVRWRRIRAAVRTGNNVSLEIPMRAMISRALPEPGVFGVFRPVLLLPEGIFSHLSPAQLRAVIAHELYHVRRRDNLSSAIHMFVETVFWFHPLLWWMGRRMVEERERACDEGVLSLGNEPHAYAEAILKICRLSAESPVACVSGVTTGDLKRRIEAIMRNRSAQRLTRSKTLLLAAAGVATVAGPFVIGMSHAPAVYAQPQAAAQPAGPVAFEVASVKAATEPVRDLMFCAGPCTFGERLTVTGSRVDIRFMSLYNLILTAYRIKPHQLSGPDWMRSQKFDIEARMPDSAAKDRLPEMLQTLLAERFKLSIRRDRKEQPVYALVVGRNGAKLKPSTPAADVPAMEARGSRALYTPQGGGRQLQDGTLVITSGPYGPMRGGRGPNGGMRFEFLKLTMPALAELLTPHVDRPVVDMTELKGTYELVSENHPLQGGGGGRKGGPPEGGPPGSDMADSGRPPDPFGEGLLAAIGKAGLKLSPGKAPVETIAVEHLEKTPTEN